MSRLDSFIRRLEAQRRCLDLAAREIGHLPGSVFELGLGHGRTYDHLRTILPDRDVFVFERLVDPEAVLRPPSQRLVLGDIHETLPVAADRFAGLVALIHADIGTGDRAHNARIAAFVRGLLPRLLVPGGLVVADQEMRFTGAQLLDPPDGVEPGRYNLYRAPAALL